MKKFLTQLIIYIAVLCVCIVGLNNIYMHLNPSDSDYVKKFNNVPSNIEICNLGSSHSLFGYNYEDIEDDYTCFNFALTSQTPSYDYRIMQYYEDKLQEGCIVFINVSYFSFIGIDEEQGDDFDSKNQRYYHFLPSEYIKNYNFFTDLFVAKLPILNARIDLIEVILDRKKDGHTNWEQTTNSIDVQSDSEAAYNRHLVKNKIDENGNVIINSKELDAVYAMIDMCKENGWKPVLVTTPFLEEYSNQVWTKSPEFIPLFYSIIDKMAEETDIDYFDYSRDAEFATRYDYFMNSDHLNKEGARILVDKLYDEMVCN